jgi:hypothetical protein
VSPKTYTCQNLIAMLKVNLRCKLALMLSFYDTTKCHIQRYEAMTLRIVDVLKSKGHPCTGTEALYRPYGP